MNMSSGRSVLDWTTKAHSPRNILQLFRLVMVLFGFYVLFAIQNVFDATFYG
jgi:hypothetical protein